MVTNNSFKSYASKFGHVDVAALLRSKFRDSWEHVELVEWSVFNLKEIELKSDVAIILINTKDKFAMAKPDNKLLSLWTLGVPVLCSPTPAYKWVLSTIGHEQYLVDESGWMKSLGSFHDSHLQELARSKRSSRETYSYL